MNYWIGVIIGASCGIIVSTVAGLLCITRLNIYENRLLNIEKRQQKIEEWYAENERVMKTYEFFNQSWQAIIDMKDEEVSR